MYPRRMRMKYSGDGFWSITEMFAGLPNEHFKTDEQLTEKERKAADALRSMANRDGTMEGCAIEFTE